jgi:polysaccharide biosynthesis transport protein
MQLNDYLRILRARKWLIILVVIITVGTTLVLTIQHSPVYQAEARLLVTADNAGVAVLGGSPSAAQPQGVETEMEILQSPFLIKRAMRTLSLDIAPRDLLRRLTVSAVGQTNIVTIQVQDADGWRAAVMANALADEYVVWSRDVKRASIAAAADEVQRRLTDTQDQIAKLSVGVSTGARQARLQSARNLSATLATQLENLRLSEQLETGSGIVMPAATSDAVRVSAHTTRYGILGLAMGLVFGLGVALLAEYRDDTIKSVGEVEDIYGAPALAHILLDKFTEDEPRRLVLTQHPNSGSAESYRLLRNTLEHLSDERKIKALLVTSAEPKEGKSSVAANLAAAMAQAGKNVVLVVCDFHQPTTEQFFDVSSTVGLSDALTGAAGVDALQAIPELGSLRVLTAGTTPPNPSELLGSVRMKQLVASLRASVDWVIIDTPALLSASDGATTARWADAVLVVTRSGVSTGDAARESKELLNNIGASVLGVVVWGLGNKRADRDYLSPRTGAGATTQWEGAPDR